MAAQSKFDISFATGITRQADIYKNKYIICTVNASILGEVLSSNSSTRFSVSTNFLKAINILHIGMSESWSFQVVNSTNVSIVLYYCGVSCLFDGSFSNYSNINRVVLQTNTSVTYDYKFYQGTSTS